MFFSISIAIIFSLTAVSCDKEVSDLCKDPIIHSADRLTNNSVRLYKYIMTSIDYIFQLITHCN